MKNPFSSITVRFWERTALNSLVTQKYAKAEEYFRKIQAVEPNKFGLGHNLALACLGQEKYEEAEQLFLAEIERYGDTFIRYKSLGDMYYIWGKREKCGEYYAKALPLCQHKEDKTQLEHRIALCKTDESFAVAMQSFEFLKQGNKKMEEKEFDKAAELLQKAAELDRCNFQALNNLGALELNINKNAAGAVKYFEKAAQYTSLVGIHGNLKKARDAAAKESKK